MRNVHKDSHAGQFRDCISLSQLIRRGCTRTIVLAALTAMSLSTALHAQQSPDARTSVRDDYFLKLWRSEQQEVVINDLNAAPASLVEALERARCALPKQEGVYVPYENWQRPIRIFKMKPGEDSRFFILAPCRGHEQAFVIPNIAEQRLYEQVLPLLLPSFAYNGSIGISAGARRLDWEKEARTLYATHSSDLAISFELALLCVRYSYKFGRQHQFMSPQGTVDLFKYEASIVCNFDKADSVTVLWTPRNLVKKLFEPK